jgi:hypothetical protein
MNKAHNSNEPHGRFVQKSDLDELDKEKPKKREPVSEIPPFQYNHRWEPRVLFMCISEFLKTGTVHPALPGYLYSLMYGCEHRVWEELVEVKLPHPRSPAPELIPMNELGREKRILALISLKEVLPVTNDTAFKDIIRQPLSSPPCENPTYVDNDCSRGWIERVINRLRRRDCLKVRENPVPGDPQETVKLILANAEAKAKWFYEEVLQNDNRLHFGASEQVRSDPCVRRVPIPCYILEKGRMMPLPPPDDAPRVDKRKRSPREAMQDFLTKGKKLMTK